MAGDAIRLETEFGAHSLEALIWVAETVDASVYAPGSLVRTASGFRFSLANPPLRIGAFSGLRLGVDGTWVPPDSVRVRLGPQGSWRDSVRLSPSNPLELQAGSWTEFEADCPLPAGPGPVTIRLELSNVAIPPLVWMEIHDTMREVAPP